MAEEQKDELKEQLAKSLAFLKVGAKNFLHLKGIARDLNVASQNIQLLLKAVGGEPRKSGQTDMHILTPDQIDKKLEVDVAKATVVPKETEEEKKPSLVGKAFDKLKSSKAGKAVGKAFTKFKGTKAGGKIVSIASKIGKYAKIFSPSNIMLAFGGLSFLYVILQSSIFDPIVEGFKEFMGNIGEMFDSLKEGVVSFIDNLKESIGEIIDEITSNVAEFFKPFTDKVKEIYDKVIGFIKDKVDKIKEFFGIPIEPKKQKIPGEDEVKAKAKEEADKEKAAKKPKKKPDEKPASAAPPPPAPAPAPAAAAPAPAAAAPTAPAKAPSKDEKPLEVTGVQATIVKSLNESGVTSPKAHANVLATVKAESNFKVQSENLLYSSAQRIMDVFGKKRIPSAEFAEPLVKNPEALANEVYKTTDGNSAPGDGFKYRGRGFIQHTGKNQYAAISKFTGADVLSNPDLLNSPEIAAKAIPWFLLSYKGLKPDDVENMSKVNKAIAFADPTGKKAAEREASAQQIQASMSGGSTGGQVASASTDVASGQRQQAKPSTPVNINASTTNNTKINKNEMAAASKPQNTAGMLAARAT